MVRGNYPILFLNIFDSLRTEEERDAFLWASDKFQNDRFGYKAEGFAREVGRLGAAVWHLIGRGLESHGDARASAKIDLYQFILRRHAHLRVPGRNDAWL